MENGGWIVALILLVVVGGVNLIAFAAVRGAFRGDDKSSMFSVLNKTVQNVQKKDGELDELRRRLEELEKGKKKDAGESES